MTKEKSFVVSSQGAIPTINGKMTSVEISSLTGKPHNDLMKAIRKMEVSWMKVGQGNFSQSSYINEQNRPMPMYVLNKPECLFIATKFNDEARALLVLRWEQLEMERVKPVSILDMMQASLDALRLQEKELAEVKQNIEVQSNRINYLEAKATTSPDFFTIVGYGTLHGVSVNRSLAADYGRKASKLCKERGIAMDSTPDPRFGRVHLYPSSVLSEVFGFETV